MNTCSFEMKYGKEFSRVIQIYRSTDFSSVLSFSIPDIRLDMNKKHPKRTLIKLTHSQPYSEKLRRE